MKHHFDQLTATTARSQYQQRQQQHLHHPAQHQHLPQHFSISVFNHFGYWPTNAAVAAVPLAAAPLPSLAAAPTYALHEPLPPTAASHLNVHELRAPPTRSHSLCSNLTNSSFGPNIAYSSDQSREPINASVAAATSIDFGVVVDRQMLQHPGNFAVTSNLNSADAAAIFPPPTTTSRGAAFATFTSAPRNLDFPPNLSTRGRAVNYGNFEFFDLKSEELPPHRVQQEQNLLQVRAQHIQLHSSVSDIEDSDSDSDKNYAQIKNSIEPLLLHEASIMSGRGYGRKR